MSDLQDAIDFVENDAVLAVVLATSHSLGIVVEAARLVANLDPKPFARYERLGGISLESCDPKDADVWIVDVAALTPGDTQ